MEKVTQTLSEQEEIRREALERIRSLGIEPYPAAQFELNTNSAEIHKAFDGKPAGTKAGTNENEGEEPKFSEVSIAGRLMARRIMGKASFAELQDANGRIQLYVSRDEICEGEDKTLYNDLFKKLLDLGDIIGVKGWVFVTKMGETTIHVTELKLLSKSLRPLPVVKEKDGQIYDSFSDPEQRYRQRYVDLLVNDGVRDTFIKRSRMTSRIRRFLDERQFLEVETPILQPIYGGAAARPFTTHHNTLDSKLFLRIADELYLKRLVVGGFEGVYEISKDFRNEGMDRFHNPEFTMMELYVAYKDYRWMMDFCEELIEDVARETNGSTVVTVDGKNIDFKRPWKRYTMYQAIEQFTGVDISQMDEKTLRDQADKMGVANDPTMGRGKLIDEIFGEKVEPLLIQPTFITDYPVEMSPLAKKHRDAPGLVERFEAVCNGKEIANAFSELNDPIDQRNRFESQLRLKDRGDEEAMALDEDFLRALEYGMPPTAGIGIGIDRLAMIMTDSHSIQEVILFPQMKPETGHSVDGEEQNNGDVKKAEL